MSMIDLMQPSASGMSAQSNRLSTIADNVANASTVGYKRAEAQFEALLFPANQWSRIRTIPEMMYGWGVVETNIRHLIDKQGALTFTKSTTDLAIEGQGFFVVTDPSLEGTNTNPFLTRAGSFVPNAEGNLINAAGYQLMGYDLTSGAAPSGVSGTSGLVPVDVVNIASQNVPTSSGVLSVNLDSTQPVVTGPTPSANSADSVYTSESGLQVYDSEGNTVTLDIYTTRTSDTAPYQWEVAVFNHADAAEQGTSFFPYSSGALTTATLSFDENGQYQSGSPISISVPGGSTMTLDMSGSTQVATQYQVRQASANGYPASPVDHVEVTETGVVRAFLSNGNYVDAYQIPLANVISENNLTVISNGNVFQANVSSSTEAAPNGVTGSGPIEVALAGENGNGLIMSEMLEQSTVDIGTELTDMIGAQRAFQLNSQGFQVGNEATQTIINLR